MKTERQRYMDNEITHEEYYLSIANECGISYKDSVELPRIKEALKYDEHLNNIPLSFWDSNSHFTRREIDKAMRKRGDFFSMAGGVCVHKAAARYAAING